MGSITIRGASDAQVAQVDSNALRTRQHNEWEQALADGRAFAWTSATHDYTALDTILGVENNSPTRDLKIKTIFATGSTATEFIVFTVSGITMTGTAVTNVGLNRNSNNTAEATAIGDETGNGEQALGYTAPLFSGRFANDGSAEIDVDGAIILPQDHMIGVDFTADGTTCNVTIWGYYVDR